MDEKNQNEQKGAPPDRGQPGDGQPYAGRKYDWGRTYRDPYTGAPQDWQKGDPKAGPITSNDEKAFSILSYIGILWLVGLLADRENQNVIFHVNQGIILSIFEFALMFSLAIAKAMIEGVFGLSAASEFCPGRDRQSAGCCRLRDGV